MRSQLFKTLIAVAVASTLTACASGNRDTDDMTSTAGASSMEQPGYGTASTAQTTTDMGVSGGSQVDTSAGSQMGATTSAQTGVSGVDATAQASASGQQYPATSQSAMAGTQAGSQVAASGTQMDSSTQSSTMSSQSSMQAQMSPAGAMKTEWIEGSQMGASSGGATAASMDQQAVCGMYAQLKSASSTEEREKVLTQILLNVPRGDSALVDVREQCASAAP